MNRRVRAATARLRPALAVLVGGVVALLLPSLLALQVNPSSAAVLAALAVAVAAVVVLNGQVATLVRGVVGWRPPTADAVPLFLAGGVTDPRHHPLCPRAPGPA